MSQDRSPGTGWLGPPSRVSTAFGNRKIWPGDTFGIARLPGGPLPRLVLSWGSATGQDKNPQIYAAVVSLPAPTSPGYPHRPCHLAG